jgi:hypothetical protein
MAKRQSAFNKAIREAQNRETVTPQDIGTVPQSNGDTVKPLNGGTVLQSNSDAVQQLNSLTVKPPNRGTAKSGLTKTSFYIRPDQADKLDDLAHEYKKRTGKRIDRQDIVRAIIDEIDLDNLLNLIKE